MTAFIDARITQGREALTKDRPFAAIKAFKTALSLAADPSRRDFCLVGLDRAMLAAGADQDAQTQWAFSLASDGTSHQTLVAMIIGALEAERPDIAKNRLNEIETHLDPIPVWQLGHKILLAASETGAAHTHLETGGGHMPPEVKARFKAQILLAENRFKEVLDLCMNGLAGSSSDLLSIRIRALHGLGRYKQVEDLIAAQRDYYPDEAWIDVELARNATAMRDRPLAVARWRQVANRRDASLSHLRGYVEALLANLDVNDARQAIAEAEAAGSLPAASTRSLSARVAAALSDYDEAMEILETAIEDFGGESSRASLARLWMESSAVAFSKYQLGEGQEWFERHVEFIRMAHSHHPVSIRIRMLLVHALVRCGAVDEALTEIERLPDGNRPEVLRLGIWAAHARGKAERTRELWNIRKRLHYIPQLEDGPSARLRRLDENPTPRPDAVTLYSLVRDERLRLPWFLDHYRRLGIRHFVMIDNASTDGSTQYLRDCPDVTLYATSDNFIGAYDGMVWINHLKAMLNPDGWAVYADTDEALVYDGCETRLLPDLIELLEGEGAEAFTGYMLDMFSPTPASSADMDAADTDYTSRYPAYLPTVFSTPSITCPYRTHNGGVRSLFGTKHDLTKTPLVKNSAGVAFLRSSHDITPARVSNMSGALLHYKITDGLAAQAQAVVADKMRSINCHFRYRKYAQAGDLGDLLKPVLDDARVYSGSRSLVETGMIPALPWTETLS